MVDHQLEARGCCTCSDSRRSFVVVVAVKTYFWNIAYALDLLINAFFGGERHETISARWGKIGKKVRLWYWACRMLHWFDRDHCEKSAAAHEKIKDATK